MENDQQQPHQSTPGHSPHPEPQHQQPTASAQHQQNVAHLPASPAHHAASQDVPMPSQQMYMQQSPKKNRKTIGIIIGVVIAVLVAGSALAFVQLINSPEARLARALDNLIEVESLTTSLSVTTEERGGEGSFTFDGEIKTVSDPVQFQGSLDADLFITRLKGEVLYNDGSYYVKVGGLNGVQDLVSGYIAGFVSGGTAVDDETQQQLNQIDAAVTRVVTELDGQWIEIQESLASQSGVDVDSVLADLRANARDLNDLGEAITVVESADETVDGEEMLRIRVSLNEAGVKRILADLLAGITIAGDTATREEILSEVDDLFESYDPTTDQFDIWVNGDDQLAQMQLVDDSDPDLVGTLTVKMTGHNSTTVESAPEDALTLLEVTGILSELSNALGVGDLQIDDLPNLLN